MIHEIDEFDRLFTITCGKCDGVYALNLWCETSAGPLPANTFQCPCCDYRFKRQIKHNRKAWDKFIEIVEVKP